MNRLTAGVLCACLVPEAASTDRARERSAVWPLIAVPVSSSRQQPTRSRVTGWTRRRKSALALRARIVPACAEEGGLRSNTDVAAAERVSLTAVGKWRQRFLENSVVQPNLQLTQQRVV